LLSSVGSMTFTVCLMAFMLKAGFTLFDASLIVGAYRLVPIAVATFFGHLSDNLPPRYTVMLTELGGAVGSLGILWAWGLGKPGYFWLLSFAVGRAIILTLQAGSRARIVKELSGPSYRSQSHHAIWLNKATQGAVFFAGILALIATHS